MWSIGWRCLVLLTYRCVYIHIRSWLLSMPCVIMFLLPPVPHTYVRAYTRCSSMKANIASHGGQPFTFNISSPEYNKVNHTASMPHSKLCGMYIYVRPTLAMGIYACVHISTYMCTYVCTYVHMWGLGMHYRLYCGVSQCSNCLVDPRMLMGLLYTDNREKQA